MTPQRPLKPRSEVDLTLDVVIKKIDETLPTIHRMGRAQTKQKKSPTDRLPPVEAKVAKARLQELCNRPILTADGTDIVDAPSRVNGSRCDDNELAAG